MKTESPRSEHRNQGKTTKSENAEEELIIITGLTRPVTVSEHRGSLATFATLREPVTVQRLQKPASSPDGNGIFHNYTNQHRVRRLFTFTRKTSYFIYESNNSLTLTSSRYLAQSLILRRPKLEQLQVPYFSRERKENRPLEYFRHRLSTKNKNV